MPELSLRVKYELEFCHYAVKIGAMQDGTIDEPPNSERDLRLAVCYGLALWERDNKALLIQHAERAQADLLQPNQRFVRAWLAAMAYPQASDQRLEPLHRPSNADDSLLLRSLTSLARACQAAARGDAYAALCSWQDALFGLRAAREHQLYFVTFAGGLKRFRLSEDYRLALRDDLSRQVNAYARASSVDKANSVE